MSKKSVGGLVKIRLALWALVGLALAGSGYLFWSQNQAAYMPGFEGPFEMQSTLGGEFTRQDLTEIPSLVLFGFTNCPDVCPTTLTQMILWRSELNLSENELRLIFVSVDPDRDTNEIMQKYLATFSSPVIGLTGTIDQTETAKLSFGVFAQKLIGTDATEEEKANYDMDHTASVLMYNSDGKFAGTINFEDNFADIMNKIVRLLGN